jgi:hypothetical protein
LFAVQFGFRNCFVEAGCVDVPCRTDRSDGMDARRRPPTRRALDLPALMPKSGAREPGRLPGIYGAE